jgi:site-specific DNA-methyltransferase (adenine-specific)
MTPYFQDAEVTLYHGDCREVLPALDVIGDLALCDPPYGETSLGWDRRVDGWLKAIGGRLGSGASLWCFGSLRSFMATAPDFGAEGWRFAQDVVWEKHNGSSSAADRFRRVHEQAAHFYRKDAPWSAVYKKVPTTPDPVKKTIRRKRRPPHWGDIGQGHYESTDGGPRLMRSVIQVRSCHGRALHPTEKPTGILTPLVECSCPPGGLVVVPFAGVGSELEAARLMGRRAIGVELDERYCELAARRLEQGVLPLLAGAAS